MSDELDAVLRVTGGADDAVARMEPEIAPLTITRTFGEAATVSIAISLKRIADAVAGNEKNSGIIHAIFDMARGQS